LAELLLGVIDAPLWTLVLWTLLSCHITLMSVTLFLHRAQAHRSVALHPILSHFFRFWLWLTTGMVTREWVAVHRKHHARCETDEDPHSPLHYGIGTVLLKGAELYREEAADPATLAKFGLGTPNDWVEKRLYSALPMLGVALLAVVEFVLFGLAGIAVFAFQMLCIPVLAAGVINGLAHYWGYRNYETDDAATNLTPLAVLICGEELHNNHHAYPSSAKFSLRRWELDLGWWYLRLFSLLGLASIKRVAPEPTFDADKVLMDMETVKAIIGSKMHVMENYARSVIRPVHRIELTGATGGLKASLTGVRNELFAADRLLDDAGRLRLQAALGASDALQTVYEFGQGLQATWNASGNSQEHLLQALQEWCRQAEATGIQCLQEFAEALHGYSLKPASVLRS